MQEFNDAPDGGGTDEGRDADAPAGASFWLEEDGCWSSPDLWIKPDAQPVGWAERSSSGWMPERSTIPVEVGVPVGVKRTAGFAANQRFLGAAAAFALVLGAGAIMATGTVRGGSEMEVSVAASAPPAPVAATAAPSSSPTPPISTPSQQTAVDRPESNVVVADDPDLGPPIDLTGIDLSTVPAPEPVATAAPRPAPAATVTPAPIPPPVVIDPIVATLARARDLHPVLAAESEAELRSLLDQACGSSSLSSALRLASSESKGGNAALQAALTYWIETGAAVSCPSLQ